MLKEKPNKKGVTLIELIIVFVIIAIGAVLIAPNVGPWLRNYRLRSATRDIVSTMRTAQMKAVSLNSEHRVSFDIAANEYLLQIKTTQSAPNDWIPTWTNARAQQLQQKLPGGVTMTAVTFPGDNAEFNPNSTSSSGSMTLTNTKQTKQITLTPSTGRIHIE
jgi:prepilin-type N-terminal cleavage/methylation domain-containing protein